jgi:hypothetical protein
LQFDDRDTGLPKGGRKAAHVFADTGRSADGELHV